MNVLVVLAKQTALVALLQWYEVHADQCQRLNEGVDPCAILFCRPGPEQLNVTVKCDASTDLDSVDLLEYTCTNASGFVTTSGSVLQEGTNFVQCNWIPVFVPDGSVACTANGDYEVWYPGTFVTFNFSPATYLPHKASECRPNSSSPPAPSLSVPQSQLTSVVSTSTANLSSAGLISQEANPFSSTTCTGCTSVAVLAAIGALAFVLAVAVIGVTLFFVKKSRNKRSALLTSTNVLDIVMLTPDKAPPPPPSTEHPAWPITSDGVCPVHLVQAESPQDPSHQARQEGHASCELSSPHQTDPTDDNFEPLYSYDSTDHTYTHTDRFKLPSYISADEFQ